MKGKTLIKILLAVLFIAALGFLIGAIYQYTDGFNEDFKTMYLERNGEKVLSSVSTVHYDCGEEVSYSVKYTFPGGKDEARDFSVDVAPNAEADFEFQVDGVTRLWRAQDLTKIFRVRKEAGGFSFAVPTPCRISDVVKALYPDAEERTLPQDLDREQAFYTLTVTSYNKAVSYTVNFSACEEVHPFTATYEVKEVEGEAIPGGYSTKIEYGTLVTNGVRGRSATIWVVISNELIQPIRLEWTGADGSSGTVYPKQPSKPISPTTVYFTVPLETDCSCIIYLNYTLSMGVMEGSE